MKSRFSIKQRLIIPIILLGIVALLSNVLAVFGINHVNSSAVKIVDDHMAGAAKLAEIRRSILNTHKMALSHIVATDYDTMITVAGQMKEEKAALDQQLAEYKDYLGQDDEPVYQQLLDHYESFQHALVFLVSASADARTQTAFEYANGDVAQFGEAVEADIIKLDQSISTQTAEAEERLMSVYFSSLVGTGGSIAACLLLAAASIRIILKYVIYPIKNMMLTLHGSSERINEVTGEVLGQTRKSNKSAKNLSTLIESLSAAIRKVARNASNINDRAEEINGDVNDMVERCGEINGYASAMKIRASEMEQMAQTNTEVIRAKVSKILIVLNKAIENSRSVDQVNSLTKDILSISTTTNLIALNASVEASRAGEAGKGFAVVACEIRDLADSCAKTATRIQDVNKIVTEAVYNLSSNAQELVNYLNESILTEFQVFVCAGQQYKEDAVYIEQVMAHFHAQTQHLKKAMADIAASMKSITNAIDEGAGGIHGAAGSTRSLAGNMADITSRMDINKEIVEQLKEQTEVFANL